MEQDEIQQRIAAIDKRLLTLKWDKEHNQLNAGMAARMEELVKEKEELEGKLKVSSVVQ